MQAPGQLAMEESTDVERAAIIEEFENEFAREKKKHYILDRVIRTGKKLGEGSFGEVEVVSPTKGCYVCWFACLLRLF